jgi:hypothetical protein
MGAVKFRVSRFGILKNHDLMDKSFNLLGEPGWEWAQGRGQEREKEPGREPGREHRGPGVSPGEASEFCQSLLSGNIGWNNLRTMTYSRERSGGGRRRRERSRSGRRRRGRSSGRRRWRRGARALLTVSN